jgi:outer membrane biosynthesis protein TonB
MGEARHFAGTLNSSDQAGLAVAIILHAAVAGLLVLQMQWKTDPPPPPVTNSMTVSLAEEVSLESTAPDPAAVARAASAPVVGETVPEPEEATPDPVPAERPVPRSTTKPRAQPSSKPSSRPSNTPRPNTPRPTPSSNPGSTDFDKAFNKGPGDSPTSTDTRVPANQIGSAEKTSLRSELNRQIRPHWQGLTPQGADAEKLVSVLSFRLAENGALQGTPTCRTKQSSITPLNRPQAALHCERAIRAVQLAAPFKLPDRLYNGWKSITNWEMKKQ